MRKALLFRQPWTLRLPWRSLNVASYTTEYMEWLWGLGRLAIVGVVVLAVATSQMSAAAAGPLLTASGAAALYAVALLLALRAGKVAFVFVAGVLLDTATALAAWWGVAAALEDAALASDLYLVAIPLLVINAARFPLWLTTAYLAMLMAWQSVLTVTYFHPSGNDVVQFPMRVLLLGLGVLMLAYLLHRRRTELEHLQARARDAERTRDELAAANECLTTKLRETVVPLQQAVRNAHTDLVSTTNDLSLRIRFIHFLEQVAERVGPPDLAPPWQRKN